MKPMRSFIAAFILLVACSCQALVRGDGVKEEFHQSYPLSTGGSVRLDNINGSIKIKMWDKNEVKIVAVKHADDEGSLEELNIVVDASRDLVNINTKYPEGENHHGYGLNTLLPCQKKQTLRE